MSEHRYEYSAALDSVMVVMAWSAVAAVASFIIWKLQLGDVVSCVSAAVTMAGFGAVIGLVVISYCIERRMKQ